METIKQLLNDYEEFKEENGDERSKGYPLLANTYILLTIISSYLLMVFWGPRIMENRKPFSLKTFTKCYNIGQVIYCAYYVVSVYLLTEVNPDGHWLMCKRWDSAVNETTKRIVFFQCLNFVIRIVELSETVVHVLRKKNAQISFLHVYHHTANFILAYVTAVYQTGGTGSTVCLINFSVHFIMYSYYLCASAESELLKKLATSFKPHLTKLQLIQFFHLTVLVAQDLMTSAVPKCYSENFLLFPSYLSMAVVVINIFFFTNFYIQNYLKKKTKSS